MQDFICGNRLVVGQWMLFDDHRREQPLAPDLLFPITVDQASEKASVSRLITAASSLVDPGKKGCFVNDAPGAYTANDCIEAIPLGVKNQVTQTAKRRPGVKVIPVSYWDQAPFAGAGV